MRSHRRLRNSQKSVVLRWQETVQSVIACAASRNWLNSMESGILGTCSGSVQFRKWHRASFFCLRRQSLFNFTDQASIFDSKILKMYGKSSIFRSKTLLTHYKQEHSHTKGGLGACVGENIWNLYLNEWRIWILQTTTSGHRRLYQILIDADEHESVHQNWHSDRSVKCTRSRSREVCNTEAKWK